MWSTLEDYKTSKGEGEGMLSVSVSEVVMLQLQQLLLKLSRNRGSTVSISQNSWLVIMRALSRRETLLSRR